MNKEEEQSLCCVVDHDDLKYADHAAIFYASASWNIGKEQSLCCIVDHDDLNYADHAGILYVEQVVFSDRSMTTESENHISLP